MDAELIASMDRWYGIRPNLDALNWHEHHFFSPMYAVSILHSTESTI